MTISIGDRLPGVPLIRMVDGAAQQVTLADRGGSLAIFAVPGAFTPTCHSAHMPSFVRTKPGFDAKGVDEVICISVNDPFVMQVWGEATGATAAGITLLADADGSFSRAMGLIFDYPPAGLLGRSQRYALHALDGVIKVLLIEETDGCAISGGEALLAAI